jgi:hypothetical protein
MPPNPAFAVARHVSALLRTEKETTDEQGQNR